MTSDDDKNLEAYVEAAARALQIPLDAAWKPSIKANLDVTLRLGLLVAEFPLPDETEPAPIFEA